MRRVSRTLSTLVAVALNRHADAAARWIAPSLHPGETILDVGCGSGRLAQALSGITRSAVVGVDPADVRRVPISFLHGRAEALPVADASFDVVLLIHVLHHLERDRHVHALREAARVCRGGVILLEATVETALQQRLTCAWDRLVNCWRADVPVPCAFRSSAEWQALGAQAGLTVEHVRRRPFLWTEPVVQTLLVFRARGVVNPVKGVVG